MKKGQKKDESAVPKSIAILPRHQRLIEGRSINLPKSMQKKLDEEIEVQGWKE